MVLNVSEKKLTPRRKCQKLQIKKVKKGKNRKGVSKTYTKYTWSTFFVAPQIYNFFFVAPQIILFIFMTPQIFYLFFVAPQNFRKIFMTPHKSSNPPPPVINGSPLRCAIPMLNSDFRVQTKNLKLRRSKTAKTAKNR